jgi:iron(III) transport system substrate-binding protein
MCGCGTADDKGLFGERRVWLNGKKMHRPKARRLTGTVSFSYLQGMVLPGNLRRFLASAVVLGGVALACGGCTLRKETWIYTSLPKEVIEEMVGPLEAAVQDAEVKWYQSSIENIEARIASELESGDLKADLVMTGNPLWYQEMKQQGRLLAYESPAVKEMAPAFRDPEHAFTTVRLTAMVMGYNPSILKPADLPERWKDLTLPKFERKVSMASPFESPATLTLVALLSRDYGWEYFAGLRKLGLVAEGSHSSVITRIETGERPLGILPLETILRVARSKAIVKPLYPLDGAIIVPGPLAIMADSEQPEVAKKIYDWMFGPVAQAAMLLGGSYSPLPKIPTPEGAKPWSELSSLVLKWEPSSLAQLLAGRDRVKAKYSDVVLHQR